MSDRVKNIHCFIHDLNSKKYPPESSHLFCIVGVIVDVKNPGIDSLTSKPIIYNVDDGTGVIKVVHFINKQIAKQNDEQIPNIVDNIEKKFLLKKNQFDNKLSMDDRFGKFINETKHLIKCSRNEFKPGTCIEVKGKIKIFNDNVELLAFSVREISDPNFEINRIFKMKTLQDKVYSSLNK